MKQVFKGCACQLAATAIVAVSSIGQAHAEPVTVIEVTCPATGPAIAACVAAGIVLNELVALENGKTPLGKNGELMKIITAPVTVLAGNLQGAKREPGMIAKGIRVFGISNMDIEKYDIFGGPNSVLRKPLG